MAVKRKHYSGLHLFLDVVLTFATGGLWLLWILIRAARSVS